MYKHIHKEKETEIYEVQQDAYVPMGEERDLYMIYKIYTRRLQGFSQELTQKINPRNEFKSPFIERRKYPQK